MPIDYRNIHIKHGPEVLRRHGAHAACDCDEDCDYCPIYSLTNRTFKDDNVNTTTHTGHSYSGCSYVLLWARMYGLPDDAQPQTQFTEPSYASRYVRASWADDDFDVEEEEEYDDG